MESHSPVKLWRNQKKMRNLLGRVGVIETFTIIYQSPKGFENQAPYPVAIADFGAKKMIGQLVDYETGEVKIGQKVRAVVRRMREDHKEGVIPYGIKFKPVDPVI